MAQDKEAELDALCLDEPADPSGRWKAKDHLAHLAWWRERNARVLDGVRTGGELPPSVEDDPQNAAIYAAYHDRPLAEIREFGRSTWRQYTAAVEACTEEDLIKPHPYAPNQLMWQDVCGTAYHHTGEHLTFWYLESGNELGAEAAHRWLRDMAPDERTRAYASYNLACFYAKVGRAADAVPLLREGFAAVPELIAHARQDPDLDRIRGSEQVRVLLQQQGVDR